MPDKSNAEAIVQRVLAENNVTYRSRAPINRRAISAWYDKVAREIVEAIREHDAEAIEALPVIGGFDKRTREQERCVRLDELRKALAKSEETP